MEENKRHNLKKHFLTEEDRVPILDISLDYQIEDETEVLATPPSYRLKKEHETNYSFVWPLYKKFRFFVNRVLGNQDENDFQNHNQLQGKFLGKHDLALEGTNEIVQNFRDYFEYKGTTQKKLDTKKIFRDYPEFWSQTGNDIDLEDQIFRGLSDEISCQEKQNTTIKCKIIKRTQYNSTNLFLYIAEITRNAEQESQLQEDIVLKVISPWESSILVLQHDILKNLVYFESYSDFKVGTDITIKYNSAWILKRLRYHLRSLEFKDNLFFTKIIYPSSPNIESINSESVNISGLTDLQLNCISQVANHNISFIWGPPGTGKTTTLGGLIENFSKLGERTLICSISNIAVDQVLISYLKRVNSVTSISKSKIIRAGNYFSQDLLIDHKYLFESQENINSIAKEISELRLKLLDEKSEDKKARLLKELSSKKSKLKDLQKNRYKEAKTIFSSAAYTMFDDLLMENTFENLVIDEVSMVNIPYIIWLSNFATKRIILTGDFRQLGPIAGSTTRFAKLWMKRDIFNILSSDYNFSQINAVYQLTEQFRMNDEIMKQINVYYNNKLITVIKDEQTVYSNLINNKPILFRNITHEVRRGNSGSKYNDGSLKYVLDLLNTINKEVGQKPAIGIITPYREQANRYKSNLNGFPNVTAGTIHSFQGSDRDIIILDLVESTKIIEKDKTNENTLGAIFFGMDGERLINVAISRAISKLIVVTNLDIFKQANIHTTKTFHDVFKALSDPSFRN